uniref:Uncharacterized protein n=1 Tax=Auxenochlorella protothecoides TaxID=3075 RepID=A0A1D1ZUL9_AUXPR
MAWFGDDPDGVCTGLLECDSLDHGASTPPAGSQFMTGLGSQQEEMEMVLCCVILAASLAMALKRLWHRSRQRSAPSPSPGWKVRYPAPSAAPPLRPRPSGSAARSPAAHTSPSAGNYYGLGPGEAGSGSESESEGGACTVSALRALRASPEFQRYMRARNLAPAVLERTTARLRLYRRLRHLDPAGFRKLCGKAPSSYDSQVPGLPIRLLEALVSQSVQSLLASAARAAWREGWHWPRVVLVVLLSAWLVGARWGAGRPVASVLFRDLWYEDVRWEHRAPAWRTMLAASLDTLPNWQAPGAGMLLALGLRCLTASGQTLGERLAGLSLVSEGLVHQSDDEDEDD